MSEYIITCDDEVAMWVGNDVESMRKIVRCRDCEKCNVGWCIHFNNVVKPNGFCSWGEKVVSE